jgi:hypothetical protein
MIFLACGTFLYYSKFIPSMTQRILVISIKKLTIRRHVSAHWAIIRPNIKHSTATFSECVHYGIAYCVQNYIDIQVQILFC